jgi:ABC-type lipoprotein release transport system permease subunit
LQSLLFEIQPNDPMTLVVTCVVLLCVALLASLGPARQAAKINPVESMRG